MKPVTIDYDLLSIRCKMEQEDFKDPEYGELNRLIRAGYVSYTSTYDPKTKVTTRVPKTVEDDETFYMFKDNGAKILAVAHLDTVISTRSNWTFEKAILGSNRNKQTCIFNPQLDDRLGVYILLDLLPNFLGDKAYDILLTTDEEVSASTAADFVAPAGKEYNWIFQFDRRGTGAVLYEYEDTAWKATVEEFLHVEIGSFSDICKLYDLGVKGMNVGTGYHDEHNDWCYMVEEEVVEQVTKFISFFRRHKDTKFPHDKTLSRWNASAYGWDDYDDGYNFRKGYWNGKQWVDGSTSASGTTVPNGASRWPLLNPSNGTNVHGAPKHSGIQRLFTRPLSDDDTLDPDDEVNLDNDYEDDNYADRDYVGQNELKMLAAVSKSMNNYDSDGNYSLTDNFVRAVAYEGEPYDWIELPAVYKEQALLRFDGAPANIPSTLVAIYHSRVNGRKACYCKACSLAVDIDDVYWTEDSVPICVDCVSTLPAGTIIQSEMPSIISSVIDEAWEVPLTDAQIQWLAEGGAIRLKPNGNIRSLVGVDSNMERCYCSICGQPEWPDKLLQFTNPLIDPNNSVEVCRECFERYQTQEGI